MKTTKALFGILSIAAALAIQAQAQSFVTNGLVAYYPFNGNANDTMGTNNGTVNGATFVTDRFGTLTNCINFSPSQTVVVQNSPVLNLFTTFSVSGWFYATNNSPSVLDHTQDLVCKGSGGAGTYQWIVRLIDGKLVFFNADGINWTQYTNTVSVTWHKWSHFVMTFDETASRINMFLDGTNSFSGPILRHIQSSVSSAIPLVFGNDSPNLSYPFYGMLDDVRIYDRAFSTNEVAQLYALESGPSVGLMKAVKPSFSSLAVGANYQLQVSTDINSWTNQGSAFTATNSSMVYPQYWDVDNWGKLFFRLQLAP